MNDDEAADIYKALKVSWPDAEVATGMWHDLLRETAHGPALAAVQELAHRGEDFPKPVRVRAVAQGYANLDRGVCALCDNSGFVFEEEPSNTVRPCDRCRPEVYNRWMAGAYKPKNTGQPAERDLDHQKARLEEMRVSLRNRT